MFVCGGMMVPIIVCLCGGMMVPIIVCLCVVEWLGGGMGIWVFTTLHEAVWYHCVFMCGGMVGVCGWGYGGMGIWVPTALHEAV